MQMDKRMISMLCSMFAVCIFALLIAMTIYSYITPKAYVVYSSKGMINGDYYDCVIPREAVSEDNTIFVAAKKNTVLGTRYRVYEENVVIEAEENGMCAVNLYEAGIMVVLAHDGRLKIGGEVLVYR